MKFMVIVLLGSLSIIVGCASRAEQNVFYNADNDCQGNLDREYNISWDSDTKEIKRNEEVTCRSLEPEPFGGQKEPTTEELKELKRNQGR